MKIKLIPCILVLFTSALVAFGIYHWCQFVEMNLIASLGAGVSLAVTLGATFAADFEHARSAVFAKVMSAIFGLAFLICHCIFCRAAEFTLTSYVLTNGIMLILWFAIVYGILQTKQ